MNQNFSLKEYTQFSWRSVTCSVTVPPLPSETPGVPLWSFPCPAEAAARQRRPWFPPREVPLSQLGASLLRCQNHLLSLEPA